MRHPERDEYKETMHRFLSNVTATLLALHTVLGCCWHHAHACACERDNVILAHRVTNIGSLDRCESHHADMHDDGCAPCHGHHGRHECQGNTCVFLGSVKSRPANSPIQPVLLPLASVAPGDLTSPQSPWFLPAIASLSPLRLHLLHRVLLL
jgi:hypothetical protein